jgi:hypothetical protein
MIKGADTLPAQKMSLLHATIMAPLCATACNSTEDALALARCNESLKALVTHTYVLKAGPGAFACIRADAKTRPEKALLRDSCAVGGAQFEEVIYPARPLPTIPPSWWDLKEGENVSYGSLGEGDWYSIAYRKRIGSAEAWFMCAGWL